MSSNPFASVCDDFYVNMRLGSQLQLPNSRDTVLHMFERMQKSFPRMTRFRKSESGDYNLEEERSGQGYRWLSLESKRLASGHVNPESIEEAVKLHTLVLEQAPYQLGVSPVELDYLDVLFGFDMSFAGNHDEIIAESLFPESPLTCLAEEAGARAIDFQPTVTMSLSDDCRLQGRIDVVTRTNSYQVRTGDYSEDAISVYFVLRRYWGDQPNESLEGMFQQMTERAEELCSKYVVPRVLRPVNSAISSRS